MADDETTSEPRTLDPDRRRSPLGKHVPLWIGFLVIVAIGIVTVLVPEISDDGDEEEDAAGATAADGDEEEDDDGAATAAAPPAPPGPSPAP